MTALFLGLSIALQSIAAWVALRIASRSRQASWLLLALAIVLMALRRTYSFYRGLIIGTFPPIGAEAIALGISILMLGALMGIERSYRSRPEWAASQNESVDSEGYLGRFAIGLGLFTIACTAVTAYFAYAASRDLMIDGALDHATSIARNYSDFAHRHPSISTDESIIDEIKLAWSDSSTRFTDSYLCIIDEAGVVKLNTRAPDMVGNFVGDAPIAPHLPNSPATFSDLLASKSAWSGHYSALDGEDQIAAMSYSAELDALVCVHVPMRAVLSEVYSQIFPWIVEIVVLVLILFPASMLLHRRAHLRALGKATAALAEVQKSEQSVRRSEERYQTLAEVVPVGIFRCNEAGQLIDANRRISDIAGRAREDLLRVGWTGLCHPDDRERIFEIMTDRSSSANCGTTSEDEIRILRPDGTIRWVSIQARQMKSIPAHVVGSMDDITTRREAELALKKARQRTREAQKLQAIGKLASGVAHDFNNMLAVIRSATANIELAGHSTEIQQIRNATTEAERVVKSLLTFGGQAVNDFKVVSLVDVVDEAMSLLRLSLSANIELRLDLPPIDRLQYVKGDSTQLIQVLVNLGLNARDAMPDGGELRITVKSKRIELDGTWHQAYATIEVSDTGKGMTSEIRDRIFEPYFSTKAENGTGLGMSIVHGIVKEHGGWIEIESTPGKGTSVIIWLPPFTESENQAAQNDIAAYCRSNDLDCVALLGERDDQVRALLRSSLLKLGLEVVEVHGYSDLSAELASTTRYALVVVSSSFDRQSRRLEISKLLQTAATRSSVVILAESGRMEGTLVAEDARVLRKPFTMPDFAETVRGSLSEATD